jgi:hypothetical protein
LGGVSVEVAAECRDDVALAPPLEPFRVEAGACDIDIQIERVSAIDARPGREVFDSGSVWRLYDHQASFQFDFRSPNLQSGPYKRLLVDNQFRRATLLLDSKCFNSCAGASPLEYPLDELLIMHRLTQERAVELHGVGIVGPDGASNLFVGHSGAGKSTTARLWTSLHDVRILSDDRIIVRDQANEIFIYGTPWHGEGCFALPECASLQRICVLEHGRGNVLTRLSPSQAVAELFARSFVPFHRHEYIDAALAFLQHVAGSIPCYLYSFEPDERAVERIMTFRD